MLYNSVITNVYVTSGRLFAHLDPVTALFGIYKYCTSKFEVQIDHITIHPIELNGPRLGSTLWKFLKMTQPLKPERVSLQTRYLLLTCTLYLQNHYCGLFTFSLGTFQVELYWNEAPKTCQNFAELSRRGYYNNTKFHRIIPDFIVQGILFACLFVHTDICLYGYSGGDPTGTGRGGQSIYGLTFNDEITRNLKHTGAGILSMANAGPNTNGSQFFVTLGPAQHLDGKHTIFGRVCSGLDVVQKLGRLPTDGNDRPTQDALIVKASLVE